MKPDESENGDEVRIHYEKGSLNKVILSRPPPIILDPPSHVSSNVKRKLQSNLKNTAYLTDAEGLSSISPSLNSWQKGRSGRTS